MILTLCALTIQQVFPDAPLTSELQKGAVVFAQGKGIDRIFQDDRKAFGTWFDGKLRRDVDEVLRLSPALMSRWLGYLSAKEKWPPEELAARWVKIKNELEGNHWFVVRLSAFPKLDLFDGSPSDSVNSSTLDNVRFQITLNGRKLPRSQTFDPYFGFVPTFAKAPEKLDGVIYANTRVQQGPTVQVRHWKEIEALTWLEPTNLGYYLLPEFYERKLADGLPLGDYHARWYLLSTHSDDEKPSQTIEVWIFRPKKQSMVSWDLQTKKATEPKKPATREEN